MAKKLATKAVEKEVVEKAPKAQKAPKEVVKEVPEEVTEKVVEATLSVAAPVYSDDFAYEIKAGKGTFPAMSDEDVMAFVASTLGKVDKIIITRQ